MIHVSDLYGRDIYSDDGKYVGKVNDVILNLEKGRIVRVTTEPLKFVSKKKAKDVLKEKSILYKNVNTVGDIIIVGKGGKSTPSEEEVETEMRKKKGRSLLGRTK